MAQLVGVFSADASLAATLARSCRGWQFTGEAAEAQACRVIVVDSSSPPDVAARKAVTRIVLYDEAPGESRRHGEIRVARGAFLANPCEYLDFAEEVVGIVMHATQLEQEVGHLMQIQELISMRDSDAVSERITRTVLNIVGLPRGVLLLHDARLERYAVSFTNDPEFVDDGEFLAGVPRELLGEALASGSFRAIDPERRLLVVALQAEDDLIGVVRVPIPPGEWPDDTALGQVSRYVRSLIQVLSDVYLQTRSRELALRDDLTKAFNRRFFDSYLDEEIERARRYGALFSIIFLDLDELKRVNELHGHLIGSRTLQEVAKRILGAVRGIDKVVRFGGDEFCVVLPQTDVDQAAAVAQRVRAAIAGSAFPIEDGLDVAITASFGVATFPTHALSKEELIQRADEAMYRVKSGSKNSVGVARAEDPVRPMR